MRLDALHVIRWVAQHLHGLVRRSQQGGDILKAALVTEGMVSNGTATKGTVASKAVTF